MKDEFENINEKKENYSPKKEEEIAFHKGCISTLINEKKELLKIISNVDKIIEIHILRLKELGVDIK